MTDEMYIMIFCGMLIFGGAFALGVKSDIPWVWAFFAAWGVYLHFSSLWSAVKKALVKIAELKDG